jgi:hypothetical protein
VGLTIVARSLLCPFRAAALGLLCAAALIRAEPPSTALPPQPALPDSAFISLQLLAGQQTGIRGQYAFLSRPDGDWLVEGYYGALITRINTSEAAGAGVRRNWRRQPAGDGRAISFNTGVDVFYQFKDAGAVLVAPSVELSYLRCFNDHGAGWEVGIIGGVGVGVWGTGSHDRGAAGQVTPLISVFTGLRF